MSKSAEALVIHAMTTYARALDTKNWALLTQVFSDDVTANYADEVICRGLDSVIAMVTAVLGPCGPTQHLLGNFDVSIAGSQSELECAVRAYHADADPHQGRHYELFGTYWARLNRYDLGWRITEFRERATLEVGTYEVLGTFPPTESHPAQT